MRGLNLGLGMKKGTVASAPGPSYLDSISGLNVEFELDATVSDSYGGSGQTWANLTASPQSGASQTDLDVYLGATSGAEASDPTFTGTAGDSGAYWALDGGDYFTEASNYAFMDLVHLASGGSEPGVVWVALAFHIATTLGVQNLIGNSDGADPGYNFRINTTGVLQFRWRVDTASATHAVANLSEPSTNMVIVSFDCSNPGAGSEKVWLNSATGAAWSAPLTSRTSTTTATGIHCIGSANQGSPLENGGKIYAAAAGKGAMTDALAAEIFANWEARHSRDYTP